MGSLEKLKLPNKKTQSPIRKNRESRLDRVLFFICLIFRLETDIIKTRKGGIVKKIIVFISIALLLLLPALSSAEVKMDTEQESGTYSTIPKLTAEETKDPPILMEGKVYPFWGPICQRYTYSVIYKDQQGRAPEYVKIYFNDQMIDMQKENPDNDNYKKGVKYIYKYVPTRIGSNFYFFEASNGVGKDRHSIIDTPANGPVLFPKDFTHNEIALIDKEKNEISWRYETNKEWIGGLALSDDGKYLAAQSWNYVYFFDTTKSEPLWIYESLSDSEIGGDVKGGIDISADGEKIFAALGNRMFLFDKKSNQPEWIYKMGEGVDGSAYNVSISSDGKFAAAALAGGGDCDTSQGQCEAQDALILWSVSSNKPLWKYQTIGNFHDVSLSRDGSYLTTATGCPDRRAYIFSRDSNQPLVKSEMLTKDSPVDESLISADGSLAAFGAESGDGAIFLFSRDSQQPLWKFATPDGASVRALGFTPEGNYIAAATIFGGNVYIFSRDSNQPLDSWNIKNASLGALDIADDGSYLAVGGTDSKVHIFSRGEQNQTSEFELNEFIGELDISGNGQYIVVGTSGSVYFFESLAESQNAQKAECSEIIEPEPEPASADIKTASKRIGLGLPLIICGSIFLLALIISAIYLILIKKKILIKNKTVAIILLMTVIISLGATLYYIFWQQPKDELDDIDQPTEEQQDSVSEPGDGQEDKTQQAECGNSMCEPGSGETAENCPQDCTGNVIEQKLE